jgi:hypothetical protein
MDLFLRRLSYGGFRVLSENGFWLMLQQKTVTVDWELLMYSLN